MRRLTINGKEYTFKFSIEASLYNECTEAMMNMFLSLGEAQGEAENAVKLAGTDEENARELVLRSFKKTFTSVANIPQTALTLFYAGLLEEHRDSIRSKDDAKELLKHFIEEIEDPDDKNYYYITNLMLECMGEDHFFELTGIAKLLMMNGDKEKKPERRRKTGDN